MAMLEEMGVIITERKATRFFYVRRIFEKIISTENYFGWYNCLLQRIKDNSLEVLVSWQSISKVNSLRDLEKVQIKCSLKLS